MAVARLTPIRIASVTLLCLAVGLAACSPAMSSRTIGILTGEAHAAEGAISTEADDWWYSVPLDGVEWQDASGVWHESGRPTCLAPSASTVSVTFAAVEVALNGSRWRPVVWVSCQTGA